MSKPVYTVNGQPVTSLVCGQTIGFDVPGYPSAWVIVEKNRAVTFDGPMDLPMPEYRLRCPEDVGQYDVKAYDFSPNGGRGVLLGRTTITVSAYASTSDLTAIPIPGAGTPPPIGQPVYTPTTGYNPMLPPSDSGGPAPIEFESGAVQEAGLFSGLSPMVLVAVGVAALLLIPQLTKGR